MSENITKTQAFKLKGRLYTLTVLHVLTNDEALFTEQCAETVARAPKLFERTPIVLDLSAVHQLEVHLNEFILIAREYGMIPVAIQGGSILHETLAQCQGIAVLNASSTQDKPVIDPSFDVSTAPAATSAKSKIISHPVRSGQQVVAKDSDLIITASVSHGAELLADGHIHIYGALRGRALAGISGNVNARIYCQSLEAELVAIAGYYRLSDAIEPIHAPCQIYLQDEHIVIERI